MRSSALALTYHPPLGSDVKSTTGIVVSYTLVGYNNLTF